MTLVFVSEARFIKGKHAVIYSEPPFNYSLWRRYLSCFDKIVVIARVKTDKNYFEQSIYRSSGENVEFVELPYYIGMMGYLRRYFALKSKIKQEVNRNLNSKFICRVPGIISTLVIKELIFNKKKFAVEVVGDPADVFAAGVIKHPLRIYLRKSMVSSLKKSVAKSDAVLYVTESTLQKKYPTRPEVFNINASNVSLEESIIPIEPKKFKVKIKYEILSVGSLAQLYKGPDVLIKALKAIKDKNITINCNWLGDGKYIDELNYMAKRLGVSDIIHFLGNVDKKRVYEALKESDVFVLASRTEGLPRAIIEAMSIGLPIVATNVGGIPELLDDQVLIEKDKPDQLADLIIKILTDENLYNQQAERNFQFAKNFSRNILKQKRESFYNYIIEHT